MCGIFGFFGKKVDSINISIMTRLLFNNVGTIAQERGQDGYGYMLNGRVYTEPKKGVLFTDHPTTDYKKVFYGVGNCRAKPETEVESSAKNIQPICKNNSYLVHNGSLSESYVKKMYERYNYQPSTNIDSEALMCMMEHAGVGQSSLEEIDGGFSFIHSKRTKENLEFTVACKYQPLYHLKVDLVGNGNHAIYHYFHSCQKAIAYLENHFKSLKPNNKIVIITTSKQVPEYSFTKYTFTGYTIKEEYGKFTPTFNYPNIHPKTDKIKVLCAASSGIDSTTSLMLANKLLSQSDTKFSIDAVHFMYGHRGQEAELHAIKKIIKYCNTKKNTNFNLKVVNLEDIYKNFFNVKNSQLINDKLSVETGTQDKLKSTIAWVPVRNMLFQTLLIGLAETYILEEGYDKVYLVAGWNQLSEEGFYPDNSSRFSNTMLKAAKFGTLVGHKIHSWNLCSNVLKSDQWLLASMYGFLDVFKYTISCDIPIIEKDNNGKITGVYNCDGQCGSTLLSMWAAKRYLDITDPRQFKEAVTTVSKDDLYKLPKQDPVKITNSDRSDVLDRIILIPEVDRR